MDNGRNHRKLGWVGARAVYLTLSLDDILSHTPTSPQLTINILDYIILFWAEGIRQVCCLEGISQQTLQCP